VRSKRPLYYLLALVALVALLIYASHRTHFQWGILAAQFRYVRWSLIALGVGLIYAAYVIRGMRWSVFLKPAFLNPAKKVGPFDLIGTQVIGFTAVALVGRVADLARPYLVARKTKVALSLQLAIYTIERMFDLGSVALIFALALLLAPDRATLPHPEIAKRVALGALAVSAALVVLALSVRLAGEAMARWLEARMRSKAGGSIAAKIRGFRDGLQSLSSLGDFLRAAGLSLLMWSMIGGAYLSTVRAFTGSSILVNMTFARCVILMAASMASSVVPIPVVSWFAQVLALQQTMMRIFGVQPEPALACGAGLLFVTFLSIIPAGLLWARFDHISLKDVSTESEHLTEEAAAVLEA
jgi:uncharacterized membrane protein YbhN (UPF0104 family)